MSDIKVMLVDDEQSFVEAMAKRLTKRNLEVVQAFSGEEGLEKLNEVFGVDVVVLDVKMPGMDGIQTLQEIRKRYPLVEVIMLTGHATVQSAIDGMKQGAFDYLMKPCDMDDLLSKVREAKAKKENHEHKIAQARAMNIANRRGD
ncbi:Response regulator receiver domain-containing protein [Desulfatibacillum alkenivorans DSM 16219]|jgi:DNA-binding NtrC family response regulator|uniref:Response regulator receiver domain-containing protein n=1 Tax=Desulfatibacillum alkenivorans DSM 16219 TaxID=1121393 RepID=A0A1M6XJQ8_9BACT|nr:response regulator [Desulfatibacillum alkenivorans]SHL06138.1 Response regulator receiver domain-containing protein [Desulfatibacillum alkenivorans DSM 16219]